MFKHIAFCFLFTLFFPFVCASGFFEIRLTFENKHNLDAEGNCCDGGRPERSLSSSSAKLSHLSASVSSEGVQRTVSVNNNSSTKKTECPQKCRTFFRICLKHYQREIRYDDECTFGYQITKVDLYSGTVRIPFDFTWPGEFSLVIEAWHQHQQLGPEYGPYKTLIMRYSIQHSVNVDQKWSKNSHRENDKFLSYSYRVMCSRDSYGKGCSQTCTPKDDDFGHWTCDENGIKCLPGWRGSYCDKPICAEGCKGTCQKPGECSCNYGYHGPLCDQCLLRPGCDHGSCNKPFECICDEGWGGPYCSLDLNYCTHHKPCKNGTCYNHGQGGYKCECYPGFEGTNCDVPIKDCSTNPCQNGAKCTTINSTSSSSYGGGGESNFECECLTGFSGRYCEKPKVYLRCSTSPCRNGGTCVDGPSGYMCICPYGYEGIDCQVKKTHCDQEPCQNNADCVSISSSSSTPLSSLSSSSSLSTSHLTKSNPGYKCKCRAGFTGDHCETNINDCNPNPCRNGGSCVDLINTFQCVCPLGFLGVYCDLAPIPAHVQSPVKLVGPQSPPFMDDQSLISSASTFEQITYSRLLLISIASLIIPVGAVIATVIIFALKKRRWKHEERKRYDNEEAMRQNEENAAKKCLQNGTYIIVNNLDREKTDSNMSKINNKPHNSCDLPLNLSPYATIGIPPPPPPCPTKMPSQPSPSDYYKFSSTLLRSKTLNTSPHNGLLYNNNLNNNSQLDNISINSNCTTINTTSNISVQSVDMSKIFDASTIKEQLSRIHK